MNQQHFPYMAYMLRLWLENNERNSEKSRIDGDWRASLEDPGTQDIRVFADLDAMFDFLLGETKRRTPSEDAGLGEVNCER